MENQIGDCNFVATSPTTDLEPLREIAKPTGLNGFINAAPDPEPDSHPQSSPSRPPGSPTIHKTMSETDNTKPPSDVESIKRGRPKGSKNKVKLSDTGIVSPTGDKIVVSERMKQQASEEDRQRYVKILNAVHEDIATAKNALHRLADNLEIIKRDRLYYAGGYKTFRELVRPRLVAEAKRIAY